MICYDNKDSAGSTVCVSYSPTFHTQRRKHGGGEGEGGPPTSREGGARKKLKTTSLGVYIHTKLI